MGASPPADGLPEEKKEKRELAFATSHLAT
jgi:hypothetical protein